MVNEIVRIHLVTGEVIIGRVMSKLSTTDTTVTINRPILMTPLPVDIGQFHHTLSPYGSVFGALPPIEILRLTPEKMLVEPMNDVPEPLKEAYIKATTGIELAKSPILGHSH